MNQETLSLDFVNTVDDRLSEHPQEMLTRYGRFLAWAAQKGLIDKEQEAELSNAGVDQEQALQQVWELRDLLFRIFSAVARGEKVAEEDLALFNRYLAEAMSNICLIQSGSGFEWFCCPGRRGTDSVLYPLVKSAADLLVSAQLDRIRICADPDCGWLFLDSSRNRSRRWCSMEGCGNRAKARRYYQRQQEKREGRDSGEERNSK